jgi:uncharacterized protein YdiU (UPF0061 family)
MPYDLDEVQFNFDNSYAKTMEGFFAPWKGEIVPDAQMVRLNKPLAKSLKLDGAILEGPIGAEIFSGSKAPKGSAGLAQVYAGHQFGGFSAQLGDGRALLLGEIIDDEGVRRDIQLKGSGKTPFSRNGDGKAALGPVLREYIMCEAMHALGIPTTRALAAVTTGEDVIRDTVLPGAVLTRVAASHIRVGTFQFFAARGETEKIRQLADYSIARHFPQLKSHENPYLSLLGSVADKQATLIAKWLLVGFVHGVMNTDNMTISCETIDYGPCAFIDNYDPAASFSSIDRNGRYAYQNQPSIGQWNLARFAETLLPLIHEDQDSAIEVATEVINSFSSLHLEYWLRGMRSKLGLFENWDDDIDLARALLTAMEGQNVDYTILFRNLAGAVEGRDDDILSMFDNAGDIENWLTNWRERIKLEEIDSSTRIASMNLCNPLYIPRNHLVEDALNTATTKSDYSKFETLMDVLADPYTKRSGIEQFAAPSPEDFGPYRTFCGT